MTPRSATTLALAFALGAGSVAAGGTVPTSGVARDASGPARGRSGLPSPPLEPMETALRDAGVGGVRGLTVGPIESALHPGRGYGTPACARTMAEARRVGATWVSLTPFGRTLDLRPTGVDPTFEVPFRENRAAVARAVRQAHAEGLRVLLVPHLWVESGAWRAEIDPGDDAAWKRWADGYRRWVLGWARVAEAAGVDMLATGVELRRWVTSERAPLFAAIIRDVRRTYHGLLTHSANWDDVEDTVIWGEVDVIGVNAFFPLAKENGAAFDELVRGAEGVAAKMGELARSWRKPILFTEIGYTTRTDPGVEPWLWPDSMSDVHVDQEAQAAATMALLTPLLSEPWFAGFFVWRTYADPDDMSQEAEWGFSPRGKLAELVVRDAFAHRWAADAPLGGAGNAATPRAERPGVY